MACCCSVNMVAGVAKLSNSPAASLTPIFDETQLSLSLRPRSSIISAQFKIMASGRQQYIKAPAASAKYNQEIEVDKVCAWSGILDREKILSNEKRVLGEFSTFEDTSNVKWLLLSLSCGGTTLISSVQAAYANEDMMMNPVYETGELFELGIQLSYLLLLLGLLGAGSFFVIRQVLVRRELDLSAKELQEQVRSGDASAIGLFELGAVMLRRKFYPAAIKFLNQAIEKWDGDDQDLAQVYNALGVSYIREGKLDKGIAQFEIAIKLQPGYVTAWNNLGDAYEKRNEAKAALKAFEEALLFDPNNTLARTRRDALKDKVKMLRGVPVKSSKPK